jgi:propanol-preferring alcohol dehydrogenase
MYKDRFETDRRDAYPGVNAVTLMEMMPKPDLRQTEILPLVRYSASRKAAKTPGYRDLCDLARACHARARFRRRRGKTRRGADGGARALGARNHDAQSRVDQEMRAGRGEDVGSIARLSKTLLDRAGAKWKGEPMAESMQAMVLDKAREPLKAAELPAPKPGENQILLKVLACGVCRTDLHIFDGELDQPKLPLVLGHEIVGRVETLGPGVEGFSVGERVGVPWLGYTDGTCPYCRMSRENLCDHPRFTGYQIDGGYAQYTVADARYCFKLPENYSDAEAAPLLCAGLIGYRSLKMADDALEGETKRLGIYGFGAAAHIVAQVARAQGCEIYAFTRPGDERAQHFARELGAAWVGGSDEKPPQLLEAVIIFAPVGPLVPTALRAVRKGGVVVCGGIHMSNIPQFPYEILWEERVVRSVANLTRDDAREFLALAPKVPVKTTVVPMKLSEANEALERLRKGELTGAAVLIP